MVAYTEPGGLRLGVTTTGADGSFNMSAAPKERYSLKVIRSDYVTPERWGPFSFDSVDDRFENDDGQAIERVLERVAPLTIGAITLAATLENRWIPEDAQRVDVDLRGLGELDFRKKLTDVPTSLPASFDGLLLGRYEVVVAKPGFEPVIRTVHLTEDAPTIDLGALTLRLTDLVLSGLDLTGTILDGCDLRGIDLRGADLSRSIISGNLGAIVAGACSVCITGDEPACQPLDFRQADLSGANLEGVTYSQNTRFEQADLLLADCSGADPQAIFAGANMSNSIMSETRVIGADLRGANLTGADLSGAILTEQRWLNVLPAEPCSPDEGPSIRLSERFIRC